MKIPSYIKKRDDVSIINNVETIYPEHLADFHLVVYYLNPSKCKLVVRRLDKPIGWDKELKIKIYSVDGKSEHSINIGPNDENSKISTYGDVSVNLQPVDLNYSQIIPKIVVQTFETNEIPLLKYNSIMTIIDLNPEYEYMFFNKKKRREFIKKNFNSNILEAYDTLVPGAYRADLFRYCVLYVHGGCYIDCKIILRKPIREWIGDENFKLVQDYGTTSRSSNGLLMFDKNNHTLLRIIKRAATNIFSKMYSDAFEITGPKLLSQFFKEYNHSLKSIIKNRDLYRDYKNSYVTDQKGDIICHMSYPGYYIGYLDTNRYLQLFHDGEIYYMDKTICGKYKIYTYPHNYRYKFTFKIKGRKLFIERTDQPIGWNFNLRLNVVNDTNNVEKFVVIGPSKSNLKIEKI
jgi:hypothetical protein